MTDEKRLQVYEDILKTAPNMYNQIMKVLRCTEVDPAQNLYLFTYIPALLSFTLWLADLVQKDDIKKLYFLSRDGYQMYIAARAMFEKMHINTDCHYLNVSRLAMRVPEYHLNPDKAIDKICVNGIDVSVRVILKRALLTDGEVSEVIDSLKGNIPEPDKVLNYHEIRSLKTQLYQSELLKKYIYKHSFTEYENTVNYLKQEGLLDCNNIALADSGWIGTLQQSIETLLRTVNDNISVCGYYFGTYEIPQNADPKGYKSFYFSSYFGLKRKMYFSNSLFETVISSDEGMTIGYSESGDSFVPVKNAGNINGDKINKNIIILEKFLDILDINNLESWQKLKNLTEKLFKLFMAKPTDLEVQCYGNWLFSDDITEGNMKAVAAVLSDKEICDQRLLSRIFILIGLKKAEIHESAWLEGSIVRNKNFVKNALWHVRLSKMVTYGRKQIKQKVSKWQKK